MEFFQISQTKYDFIKPLRSLRKLRFAVFLTFLILMVWKKGMLTTFSVEPDY